MIVKYHPYILFFEGKDLILSEKCIKVFVGLEEVEKFFFESEEMAKDAWLYIFDRYQKKYNTADLDEFVKRNDVTYKIC